MGKQNSNEERRLVQSHIKLIRDKKYQILNDPEVKGDLSVDGYNNQEILEMLYSHMSDKAINKVTGLGLRHIKKARRLFPYKRCKQCKKLKIFTDEFFTIEKRNRSGLSSTCKLCVQKKQKRAYRKKLKSSEKCKVNDCESTAMTAGYCTKHYLQLMRHGEIFERTFLDKNNFEIKGKVGYISIFEAGKNGELLGMVLVDSEDIEHLRKFKWRLSGSRIITNGKPKNIREHILDPVPGLWTQNLNGDIWDCRKSNLIQRTRSEAAKYRKKTN